MEDVTSHSFLQGADYPLLITALLSTFIADAVTLFSALVIVTVAMMIGMAILTTAWNLFRSVFATGRS